MNKIILNLNDKNLDAAILGSGVFASVVDWLATHTDLVAIWVGTIIIPATIRIWQMREKLKDNRVRRAREAEIHKLTLKQMQQDIQQDQDLHNKKIKGNDPS